MIPARHDRAFTLVEVVVAVGVVTTGLLAIIGLTSAAVHATSETRDQDAALRLRSAIDRAFHAGVQYQEIYEAIRNETPIYVYCYGAETNATPNPDGTPGATSESDFVLADKHISVARISAEPTLDAEWAASQIIFRAEIALFDPVNGDPINPSDPAQMPADPFALQPARLGAVVTLFKLPPGTSEPAEIPRGTPITTFNTILRP